MTVKFVSNNFFHSLPLVYCTVPVHHLVIALSFAFLQGMVFFNKISCHYKKHTKKELVLSHSLSDCVWQSCEALNCLWSLERLCRHHFWGENHRFQCGWTLLQTTVGIHHSIHILKTDRGLTVTRQIFHKFNNIWPTHTCNMHSHRYRYKFITCLTK